uniref:Flavin-containing monooxygenase n=1 Tax=Brassica oleracea TaxID=3712 RepID=A0A3P6C0S6_BRAOL|nr:unnamed protein product [Brassica oleracea]
MALSSSSIISRHVAVNGAGAAALVAARELRQKRQEYVGGTWNYTDHVEQDPLSVDPTRPIVYSSVYGSLELIFLESVWDSQTSCFDPTRKIKRSEEVSSHGEVLAYLQDFC